MKVAKCLTNFRPDSGHSDQEDTDDIEEEDRKNECKPRFFLHWLRPE